LNSRKKPINGSKVLFLGVAYKPDIDDARESPALRIMEEVAKKGGEVSYHDPYVADVETEEGRRYRNVPLTHAMLAQSDCVVISTNHKKIDYSDVARHARLIVDMRNAIPDGGANIYKF
jgi:UDP-N-acetyl-D-glucosamine dehydrogenase